MATPGNATREEIQALAADPDEVTLLACRPVDWNDFPEGKRPDDLGIAVAPLEDGHFDTTCALCKIDVRMGPRQRIAYLANPSFMLVVDLLCAALIAQYADDTDVFTLGGR